MLSGKEKWDIVARELDRAEESTRPSRSLRSTLLWSLLVLVAVSVALVGGFTLLRFLARWGWAVMVS